MRNTVEMQEEGVETFAYMDSATEGDTFTGRDDGTLEDDRIESSASCEWKKGTGWVCRPYNQELVTNEILQANRLGEKGHAAVLELLKNKGIRVFVVDAKVSPAVSDIMASIRDVIHHITTKSREPSFLGKPKEANRCLLYKDKFGRYFNLTLPPYTAAAAGTFQHYLDSFSGVQAMSILLVLCRSFPCGTDTSSISEQFRPAYLGVLLGLVFTEEISFSWINTAMLVRGMPSMSAYSLDTNMESDWMRKVLLFMLYLSAAATGHAQAVLTLCGITLACLILLANLGSRAWGFLGWRPIYGGGGLLSSIVSYAAAVATGVVVPYLGHREMQVGGKSAIEIALKHALIVAIIFVISDYDDFQSFIVLGSETCDQDYVNIAVGAWWAASLLVSLVLIRKIPNTNPFPSDDEPVLEEDHSSPVGFKVPSLPDFPVDPIYEQKGLSCCNESIEFLLGIVVAIAGGVGIAYLAFTTFDDELAEGL